MSGKNTCLLVFDDAASGAWNMALDEALLDDAVSSNRTTLRFYSWSKPTLSLGYFQQYADRESHPSSLDLPVVRRCTGGGALVHHHELTYSLVLPPSDPRTRDAVALTCLVHQALLEAVAEIAGENNFLTTCSAAIAESEPAEPFLCFQRRSSGDVLSGDGKYKVCGSAQRRRRGALLQHGGLIFSRSVYAPQLPGLAEIHTAQTPWDEPSHQQKLQTIWGRKILAELDLHPSEEPPGDHIIKLAKEKMAARNTDSTWVHKR